MADIENGKLLRQIYEDVTIVKTKLEDFISTVDDHEKRIRFLERGFWIAVGVIGLVELFFKIIKGG